MNVLRKWYVMRQPVEKGVAWDIQCVLAAVVVADTILRLVNHSHRHHVHVTDLPLGLRL
jgi:hypothetical protein